MFLFVIFLIHSSLNQVSANEVVSSTSIKNGIQWYVPWLHQDEEETNNNDLVIQSKPKSGNKKYTVNCNIHNTHDPVVRLYTDDGVLLEVARMLKTTDGKACDHSKLQNMIIPQPENQGKVRVLYLIINDRGYTCVERIYTVIRSQLMAEVGRQHHEGANCPTSVNNYVKENPDFKVSGGIEKLTEAKERTESPYKTKVFAQEVFPWENPNDKPFTMICRRHMVDDEHSIIIGSVSHQAYAGVVLESFQMQSCSVKHINIDRKKSMKGEHFKTVFQKADGICQEREYRYYVEKSNNYYNRITVKRFDPKNIKCPSTFTGKLYTPWYVKLMRFFFFLWLW